MPNNKKNEGDSCSRGTAERGRRDCEGANERRKKRESLGVPRFSPLGITHGRILGIDSLTLTQHYY